jgi:ferric-dicitrate binding protein FerR (iron transport regulator)
MQQNTDKIDELLNSLGTDRENVRTAMRLDARRTDAWENVERQTTHRVISMSNLKVLLRVAAVFIPLIIVGLIWQFNVHAPETYAYTTTTERDTVTLKDGTVVIMNVNTELKYQQTGRVRSVEIEGMAYFDVARNETLPFVITADEAEVTVLGTKFTVENIEQRDRICVSVEEGKVKFEVGEHSVQLMDNDMAQWTADGHISVSRKSSDDNSSWLNGFIKLNDASLNDVVDKLLVHYPEIMGVKDMCAADTVRVTTSFASQSLISVLDELTIHFGKKLELDNGYLIISY